MVVSSPAAELPPLHLSGLKIRTFALLPAWLMPPNPEPPTSPCGCPAAAERGGGTRAGRSAVLPSATSAFRCAGGGHGQRLRRLVRGRVSVCADTGDQARAVKTPRCHHRAASKRAGRAPPRTGAAQAPWGWQHVPDPGQGEQDIFSFANLHYVSNLMDVIFLLGLLLHYGTDNGALQVGFLSSSVRRCETSASR